MKRKKNVQHTNLRRRPALTAREEKPRPRRGKKNLQHTISRGSPKVRKARRKMVTIDADAPRTRRGVGGRMFT